MMRYRLFAFCWAVAGMILGGCARSDSASEPEFAAAFAAYVQRSLPGSTATVEAPLTVRVTLADGHAETVDLASALREWQETGGDREAIFARYLPAQPATDAPAGTQVDPARVLPVVKSSRALDELADAAKREGQAIPAHEALNEELYVFYVEEREEGRRYLSPADLNAVGLTADVRRARAVENLRTRRPDAEVRGEDGLYVVTADGVYEPSFLLTDRLWAPETLPVRGAIVVAVPSRDALVVTGSQDSANLARVRELVATAMTRAAEPISEKLFIRRGGRWVVFEQTVPGPP